LLHPQSREQDLSLANKMIAEMRKKVEEEDR
jgi:hypothetical protein